MLPVLISFSTTWAIGIALAGGAIYAGYHLWIDRKDGRNSALWGLGIGIAAAVVAWKYAKPIPLHTYGLLVAGAFLVGTWVAGREARRLTPLYAKIRKGKHYRFPDENDVLDVSFWILIASLVGSRVLFVIVNWDHYKRNPANIFSVSGGLVFYGGLIGAIGAALVFCRRRKIRFLELGDALIPSVAFGHVMGRMGCFAAGCCWGKVSGSDYPLRALFPRDALAYSSQLSSGLISSGAQTTLPLHPTQLYEATGELLVFFLLIVVRSRFKRFHGQIVLTYFIVYSILRTTIESFRGDFERGMILRWPVENPLILSTSQFISLGFAVAGVALLVWIQRNRRGAKLA